MLILLLEHFCNSTRLKTKTNLLLNILSYTHYESGAYTMWGVRGLRLHEIR